MPNPLSLPTRSIGPIEMLLSTLLNLGEQPPQPQAQPQGQNTQGAQPQAQGGKAGPSGPPKPGPLEILFPGGLNKFVESLSLLLQRPPQQTPRVMDTGGIAGLNGPETIQVGRPEAIVPLNRPQAPNANAMLPALLQMILRRPQAPSPVVQRPMVPSQNTGIFGDLLKYFQNRQGSNTGLPTLGSNVNRMSGLSSLI